MLNSDSAQVILCVFLSYCFSEFEEDAEFCSLGIAGLYHKELVKWSSSQVSQLQATQSFSWDPIISELRYRTTLLHDTCHMIFSSSHHWHKKYDEKTLFLKPKVMHAFPADFYLHVYLFILHLSHLLDKSIVNIIKFNSWINFLSWSCSPSPKSILFSVGC